jgi:hypothetical protein
MWKFPGFTSRTGLTGGAHRPDRVSLVRLEVGVPLHSRVREVGCWFLGLVAVQWLRGLAHLGSESETCVGSRIHLVGVSISFEKNFYRLPLTPPLSGSPFRSFKWY